MEKKPTNILVTATSRRVALVRAFKNALEKLGIPGRVIASDIDPYSAGLSFADEYRKVPLSTDPGFIPAIMEICRKDDIALLIPTIDEEIPVFGKHRQAFADIGVQIPVVDEKTGDICNDKYLTYTHLSAMGIPIARTWLPEEIREEKDITFPLFIKPRIGRGAVGAHPVNDRRELEFFLDYVKDPVVQTYLEGDEYTIDVLCDFNGDVISVVPRRRLVIRSGVSDRGRTVRDMDMINLAADAARRLHIRGPANFQCKKEGNAITFFEVNPRFSGAIQLTMAAGADFPLMIVQMLNGGIAPRLGEFKGDLTMVSYEESIYHNGASTRP